MAEPLFSDSQKTELAKHKMLYQHNLSKAKAHAQCSLQAASSLMELYVVFSDAVERIRSQKEMLEFQRRLSDNVGIEINFRAEELAQRKLELKERLAELIKKTKANITRLRKNSNR